MKHEAVPATPGSLRFQTGMAKGGAADIATRIHVVRGVQVMLDWDLAACYGVETRALNQAVKRNMDRFPERFRFQLTKAEMDELITNCDKSRNKKHYPGTAAAFTEQGIAMLSAILRSPTAVATSVRIMDAFVAMRKVLASMSPVLARLEASERRQIEDRTRQMADQERNEARFAEIFDAMRDKRFPDQKVFYDGQVYDARAFATKYILSARKSILLIDNWIDVATLDVLAKKKSGVAVEIVTSPRGNHLAASDVEAFNAQYGGLTVRTSVRFHDRFVIVDDKSLYLFGASLKDLGKKCFAFTKLDAAEIPGLKARV